MNKSDDDIRRKVMVPLVAGRHQADTIDYSFVVEMDRISESLENLLFRTAIMKELNNVMVSDMDNTMDTNEKENERKQSDVKYRIADLKTFLPHNNEGTSDQCISDVCTLTEAIDYIKKLQMESAQHQALTDKLNGAYIQCVNLAARLQRLKEITSTKMDDSSPPEERN